MGALFRGWHVSHHQRWRQLAGSDQLRYPRCFLSHGLLARQYHCSFRCLQFGLASFGARARGTVGGTGAERICQRFRFSPIESKHHVRRGRQCCRTGSCRQWHLQIDGQRENLDKHDRLGYTHDTGLPRQRRHLSQFSQCPGGRLGWEN